MTRAASGHRILNNCDVVATVDAAFEQALKTHPKGFPRRNTASQVTQFVCASSVGRSPSTSTCLLTIDLWDERETGIPGPHSAANHDLGATWAGTGDLSGSSDDRLISHRLPQSVTWLDRKAGHIVGWADAKRLSMLERTKPLHRLLSVWYHDHGVHVIHAGLVSQNGRGVLFPGPGEAGKSTAALASVCAGFKYLGDDSLGLASEHDDSLVGVSLYNSMRLQPDDLVRFPRLLPYAVQPQANPQHRSEQKCLILLAQVFPLQLERVAPIHALALPRIVNRATSQIHQATKGEALLRIAPSSMLRALPRPKAHGLDRLAQLVDRVPAYWLEMGRDIDQIASQVQEILDRAPPAGESCV